MTQFIEQMESPRSLPQLSELNQFFPMMTTGSLSETRTSSELFVKHTHLSRGTNLPELNFGCVDDLIYPVGQMYEHALQQYQVDFLTTRMYHAFVTDGTIILHVSPLCHRFARVKIVDKMYASQMAKSDRASYICAHWLGDSNQTIDLNAVCRPGQVQYYIKHNVVLERSSNHEQIPMSFLLAFTEWYKQHPEKNYLLSPVTLWSPAFVHISEASSLAIC